MAKKYSRSGEEVMALIFGNEFSKLEILKRVSDIRQLAGAQPFELQDGSERGTRGVRLYNAAGLDFNVITDRGMGVTHLSWKGVQLSMLTPAGTVHPAFTEQPGLGWLRTWPAGFLTVCGLSQVGEPCRDGDEELGQHGRAASLPASQVNWGGGWEKDQYTVWVEGVLREGVVFGPQLSMRRKIWTRLGESRFWIEDTVTNDGFLPAPHMLLQHFNLGFPLLDSGSHLELPESMVEPRDEVSRPGLGSWMDFETPGEGVKEKVFYHDLKPDADGMVTIQLRNKSFNRGQGLGVYWKYSKQEYPVLVEWKMMAEGLYVLGVEPANCHVEGRVKEQENGTLQVLAPGEVRVYHMEVGFN
jgi:hypothetical protein